MNCAWTQSEPPRGSGWVRRKHARGFALKSLGSEISLCNLCVLCVSVVCFCSEFIKHRDTENTEVAQRRAPFGVLGQSLERVYAVPTRYREVVLTVPNRNF